jgi:hypothetical protein
VVAAGGESVLKEGQVTPRVLKEEARESPTYQLKTILNIMSMDLTI